MAARRRRAGALRYCHLDDWICPTSLYLVEKGDRKDLWLIARPALIPSQEDEGTVPVFIPEAGEEVVYERVVLSGDQEGVMGNDCLFKHLEDGQETPYSLPILLANCPAELRFGPKEYSLSPNGGGGRMDHDANPPRPDDEGDGGSSQNEKALFTAKLESVVSSVGVLAEEIRAMKAQRAGTEPALSDAPRGPVAEDATTRQLLAQVTALQQQLTQARPTTPLGELPNASHAPRGAGGVRFAMGGPIAPQKPRDEEEEEEEAFLNSLRADTFANVTGAGGSKQPKAGPARKAGPDWQQEAWKRIAFTESARAAGGPSLEQMIETGDDTEPEAPLHPRDAAMIKAMDKLFKNHGTRSTMDDDLLSDDLVKSSSAKGMARKVALDRKFKENPMAKYDHVLAKAREGVGIEEENYGDAQVMKKYFQDHVALGKFKMATYILELVVEVHASTLKKDSKKVLGILASMYQFLEQYVTDKGDFFMASFTTHQPEPSQYSAPPSDLPLGKLLEREVAAAAVAYGKDVEALRKFRDENARR